MGERGALGWGEGERELAAEGGVRNGSSRRSGLRGGVDGMEADGGREACAGRARGSGDGGGVNMGGDGGGIGRKSVRGKEGRRTGAGREKKPRGTAEDGPAVLDYTDGGALCGGAVATGRRNSRRW